MSLSLRIGLLVVALLASGGLPPSASLEAPPVAALGPVEGRGVVRLDGVRPRPPRVESGRGVEPGEALISGDASRFELRPVAGGGVWRVGRRAIFAFRTNGGARLLAGTAFVQVPAGAEWRVESMRSAAVLPAGSWLVQAVDNRGLKVVCLDGPGVVQAWGEALSPRETAAATLKLRPGELTFLQPGGTAFSPAVTIYLEETLATSRLINGFPEELPGMRRLINQAVAQRQRLKGLSQAVIVGAAAPGGFQVAVPDGGQGKALEGAITPKNETTDADRR